MVEEEDVGHRFGRLLILMLLMLGRIPVFAAVETTTVTDKVILPSGGVATGGTITATLSSSGSAPDGAASQVVGGRVSVAIDPNGRPVGLALVPNDVITPAGTYYDVTISVTGPVRTSWTQRWSVTTSPDPVSIGAITRLDSVPSLSFAIDNLSDVQITSVANLDNLQYDSASKQWKNNQALNSHTTATNVHGVGALNAVVGTGTTQTLTNKTIDGGAAAGTNRLQIRREATDCTAVIGKPGELCYQQNTDALYVCEDAGDAICDTPAEWKVAGIPTSIVDVKGDLIAATGADTVVRLPAGANGTVLEADSSQTAGLRMRYIDWTLWSSIGGWQNMLGSNSGQVWTANRVWCARMIVPQGTRLPADSITYNVTTADAVNDLAACIYDDGGTTLLASNNDCSTASIGTTACALAYTAIAGAYNVCITSASGTLAIGRLSDSRPLPMTRSIGYQAGGGTTCPATITYPYTTQDTGTIPYIWRLEDRN